VEFSIGSVPGRPAVRLPLRARAGIPGRPAVRGQLLSDAFELLPTGLLIVSDDRRILTWNPAVEDLAGNVIESAQTCCDILGCRSPGTSLEGLCLTELALARGSTLPTLAVDTPGQTGATLSVTATPLMRSGKSSVLFELRPGATPTTAESRHPTVVRVRTLGQTVLETPDGEVSGGWLDHRPGRLFKYLVAHRYTPMHADSIAEALWPRARADTTNTVRHFIHALREKLEPERGRYARSEYVLARKGGYLLNPERVVVDADEFEREAKAGLIALHANERDTAIKRMQRALELYRGDFLIDERFEDWAIPERERLRELVIKPLEILSELTDNPHRAAGYLERLAEMEPLDVDIHRKLISLWLRQGRRGRALRHYRALQSRLMRELGERVSFDLSELARSRPFSL
jgi:DNA-binding SARP family transcriptional activator